MEAEEAIFYITKRFGHQVSVENGEMEKKGAGLSSETSSASSKSTDSDEKKIQQKRSCNDNL
ncbi:unnamed protein product [Gongylonema pulchrum]|uniref:Uncharacterized protein n=1 Tax=Gongylonema pulchrum TaxID=637853 RepID=A0A3P6RHA4_9BILA|nr:unnamed protein product [Gongylonema pulchrum]